MLAGLLANQVVIVPSASGMSRLAGARRRYFTGVGYQLVFDDEEIAEAMIMIELLGDKVSIH